MFQRPLRVCFGEFEMDEHAGELRKEGIKVRLQEQPLQILQILLEHILEELQELSKSKYVMAYWMALIYAGLKQIDNAFQSLEKAYQEKSPTLAFLRIDPRLEPLHADKRFEDHLNRLRLPALAPGEPEEIRQKQFRLMTE